MLKKLKVNDIDNIMQFWKNEIVNNKQKINKEYFSDEYNKIQDQFLKNISTTILYTEDDVINGCISVNKENGEIWFIAVKPNIRREGIGSILVQSCKKEFDNLSVKIKEEDIVCINFFEKNEFCILEENQNENNNQDRFITLNWEKNTTKKISLIYFDNSIDQEEIKKYTDISYHSINVNKFIKNEEENKDNIKEYIALRKKLEIGMKADIVLVYIDYNNYHENLNDTIKDVAKINGVDLNIIVCEPFSIEGTKKAGIVAKIEEAYRNYKIHKINSTIDIKDDISINQIFQKRSEIVLERIEKIAENM